MCATASLSGTWRREKEYVNREQLNGLRSSETRAVSHEHVTGDDRKNSISGTVPSLSTPEKISLLGQSYAKYLYLGTLTQWYTTIL